MKKFIILFKNWLFNVRKKQAIKKAQQLANEQRRNFSAQLQGQTNCRFYEADQVLDKHQAGEQRC